MTDFLPPPGTAYEDLETPRHVADLADAAHAHDLTLDVLVEVEIGLNRTGLPPGPEAVKLVQSIEKDNRLRFAGLSSHEGSMVITDPEVREEKVRARSVCRLPGPPGRRR